MVMVFFLVFSILGMAFIKVGRFERVHAFNHYQKSQAYYHAAGGIHKGLWRLNKVHVDSATFSESTVSVVYDSSNLTLTAAGRAGTLTDTIKVYLASGTGGSSSETLRPTGAGSWSSNNDRGCSRNWQCVDDNTSDEDATFVWGRRNSWLTDTYATGDATGTGTIEKVIIYIRVRTNFTGVRTRTVVYTGGGRYYGSEINMNGINSYTDFSTSYTTNPATDSPWTLSEVNAMQAGVRIRGYARCTQVWAVVHYQGGGNSDYTITRWEEP